MVTKTNISDVAILLDSDYWLIYCYTPSQTLQYQMVYFIVPTMNFNQYFI